MNTVTGIHVSLIPHVEAAHAAGFTVHVPVSTWAGATRPAGHVYVTRQGEPGIALMQVPTFPAFEPISIDVPVVPSRVHGSAVLQDHDGTPEDAVRLLTEIMARDDVMTRFVESPRLVKVDRRISESAVPYGEE